MVDDVRKMPINKDDLEEVIEKVGKIPFLVKLFEQNIVFNKFLESLSLTTEFYEWIDVFYKSPEGLRLERDMKLKAFSLEVRKVARKIFGGDIEIKGIPMPFPPIPKKILNEIAKKMCKEGDEADECEESPLRDLENEEI